MKFRLAAKLMELILGTAINDDEPRADMYLPVKILSLTPVMVIACIILVVYAVLKASVPAAVGAAACLALGIAAMLCWRNQKIVMLSDDEFEYSTFMGNKTVYRFDDIKQLRKNNDSMTLYVANGKVHIESGAIMTRRLIDRIDRALSKDSPKE